MVGPQQQLYEKLDCRTASGVANVEPDEPFRAPVANLNLHPVYLKPQQVLDMTSACLLYTSPSPRDQRGSRMPSSA